MAPGAAVRGSGSCCGSRRVGYLSSKMLAVKFSYALRF